MFECSSARQIEYCGNGAWEDLDYDDEGQSEKYIKAGELGVGEYSNLNEIEYCGDDENEHVISANGHTRCCDKSTDTLDESGNCVLQLNNCAGNSGYYNQNPFDGWMCCDETQINVDGECCIDDDCPGSTTCGTDHMCKCRQLTQTCSTHSDCCLSDGSTGKPWCDKAEYPSDPNLGKCKGSSDCEINPLFSLSCPSGSASCIKIKNDKNYACCSASHLGLSGGLSQTITTY